MDNIEKRWEHGNSQISDTEGAIQPYNYKKIDGLYRVRYYGIKLSKIIE